MPNLWTPAQVFHRSAREHPDPTEIVADASRSSYAEVDARSSSLAAAMTEVGPGSGDRMAIILPNSCGTTTGSSGLRTGRSYTPDAFFLTGGLGIIDEDGNAASGRCLRDRCPPRPSWVSWCAHASHPSKAP
jgi:acyl-CoA synthetase (AMP-forming)/AMP-acid ligase II